MIAVWWCFELKKYRVMLDGEILNHKHYSFEGFINKYVLNKLIRIGKII